MKFSLDEKTVYASTGGRDIKVGQDWIVFVHGAGQSHLTWSQQARAFAYEGYNVLALDLPGHGASDGPALKSVAEMADWVIKVLDDQNIENVHLVNHSMGGLICLEIASKVPDRVASVSFIATAMTIAVGPVLIDWARDDPAKAFGFMTGLGLSSYGHKHDCSVPGVSLVGSGLQIMDLNEVDSLPADLTACVEYSGGASAAANIQCPCQNMIADMDRMVAPKFGRMLHDALNISVLHELTDTGHMIPAERPREVNQILRNFLLTI